MRTRRLMGDRKAHSASIFQIRFGVAAPSSRLLRAGSPPLLQFLQTAPRRHDRVFLGTRPILHVGGGDEGSVGQDFEFGIAGVAGVNESEIQFRDL